MYLQRGDYTLTDDPESLQVDRIHAYLARSYWAEGIPISIVEESMKHSLCFGLYHQGLQIGFARVITDRATFAYLCDVYILEEFQGQGLAQWMLGEIMAHPDLQGLRRFMLVTRDAQTLYQRFGFTNPEDPSRVMEIAPQGLYLRGPHS